jgi:hypothetical protein
VRAKLGLLMVKQLILVCRLSNVLLMINRETLVKLFTNLMQVGTSEFSVPKSAWPSGELLRWKRF